MSNLLLILGIGFLVSFPALALPVPDMVKAAKDVCLVKHKGTFSNDLYSINKETNELCYEVKCAFINDKSKNDLNRAVYCTGPLNSELMSSSNEVVTKKNQDKCADDCHFEGASRDVVVCSGERFAKIGKNITDGARESGLKKIPGNSSNGSKATPFGEKN